MLKLYAVSVASVLATVLSASALGTDTSVHFATLTSPVFVGKYEVRNADRGAVKRIKVFYGGDRIATIVLRRGSETFHCCTTDACSQVEDVKACTTLKIKCDTDGVCSAE